MISEIEILPVVTCLNGAISNTRLYTADHPQVKRYLKRAYNQLRQVLRDQSDLTFLIVDGDVVVNNQPLASKTPHLNQFAQTLHHSAIERLTFSSHLSLEELGRLVKDLADPQKDILRSSSGVKLGKIHVQDGSAADSAQMPLSPEIKEQLETLALFRQQSLDDLKEIYHQIKASRGITALGLEEMVNGFLHGMLRNVNPLQMLAALKTTDEYTFTHAVNVCILTMAQAESLGIQGTMLHDIGIAAALHDAGKMFVPDDILNKPDKLTDEEWRHMRAHSAEGAQFILRLSGVPKLAFLAALEHHIRYDGSGYPDMGKQWRPNIVSQMIAISDVFDAMRSRRVYKEPKPDALIVQILKSESGTAFNPHLVENFLKLIKAQ